MVIVVADAALQTRVVSCGKDASIFVNPAVAEEVSLFLSRSYALIPVISVKAVNVLPYWHVLHSRTG